MYIFFNLSKIVNNKVYNLFAIHANIKLNVLINVDIWLLIKLNSKVIFKFNLILITQINFIKKKILKLFSLFQIISLNYVYLIISQNLINSWDNYYLKHWKWLIKIKVTNYNIVFKKNLMNNHLLIYNKKY